MTRSARSSTAAPATSAARSGPSSKPRPSKAEAARKKKAALAEELRNIYRKIDAKATTTADAPQPEAGVPGLDSYFGPELGWEPRREFDLFHERRTCPETGEAFEVLVCPVCRDRPGVIPDSCACMGCLRSRHDARIAGIFSMEARKGDPVCWNPFNKVVLDHRDGRIDRARTDQERALRRLPIPWTPAIGDVEVHQPPVF